MKVCIADLPGERLAEAEAALIAAAAGGADDVLAVPTDVARREDIVYSPADRAGPLRCGARADEQCRRAARQRHVRAE